jgi:dCTP deaminase
VNTTPLEPEWCGHITVEISNTAPVPVKLYGNEGLMQIIFFAGDQTCEVSYKDRAGKYQNQTKITLPI